MKTVRNVEYRYRVPDLSPMCDEKNVNSTGIRTRDPPRGRRILYPPSHGNYTCSSISLASYILNHRRSFTFIRRNILRKIHWKMLILSLVCLGKIGGKLQGQCGVHLMIGVNLQSGFYGRIYISFDHLCFGQVDFKFKSNWRGACPVGRTFKNLSVEPCPGREMSKNLFSLTPSISRGLSLG